MAEGELNDVPNPPPPTVRRHKPQCVPLAAKPRKRDGGAQTPWEVKRIAAEEKMGVRRRPHGGTGKPRKKRVHGAVNLPKDWKKSRHQGLAAKLLAYRKRAA